MPGELHCHCSHKLCRINIYVLFFSRFLYRKNPHVRATDHVPSFQRRAMTEEANKDTMDTPTSLDEAQLQSLTLPPDPGSTGLTVLGARLVAQHAACCNSNCTYQIKARQ